MKIYIAILYKENVCDLKPEDILVFTDYFIYQDFKENDDNAYYYFEKEI